MPIPFEVARGAETTDPETVTETAWSSVELDPEKEEEEGEGESVGEPDSEEEEEEGVLLEFLLLLADEVAAGGV